MSHVALTWAYVVVSSSSPLTITQPAACVTASAIKVPRTSLFMSILPRVVDGPRMDDAAQYLFTRECEARNAPARCDARQPHWHMHVWKLHEETSSNSSTPPRLTVLPTIT